jgi:hypothetical protein
MGCMPRLDAETIERMRQFSVVARIALQVSPARVGPTMGGHVAANPIIALGREQFGLTWPQARRCIARAENYLDQFPKPRKRR